MVEVDLVGVPSSYAINKAREAGYYHSPCFENEALVERMRDINQLILDKLY